MILIVILNFSKIKHWGKSSKSERKDLVSSRCKWIENCGSNMPNSRAVWLGVDDYCSG